MYGGIRVQSNNLILDNSRSVKPKKLKNGQKKLKIWLPKKLLTLQQKKPLKPKSWQRKRRKKR